MRTSSHLIAAACILSVVATLYSGCSSSGTTTYKSAGAASSQWNGAVFPANNFWNVRVDALPVHPKSQQWVNAIGADSFFHADFGSGTWDGGPIGIPFNIVTGGTVKKTVHFEYADESDAGPYPIPDNAAREWGSDHHILLVSESEGRLYELYHASFDGGQWNAGSGAIWDLASNDLRPRGWTSSDLAGLPILPGLVLYDQVSSGALRHAIRFTAFNTAEGHIWPARHPLPDLTGTDHWLDAPPMGARFRLKGSYVIPDSASAEVKVILQAMKQYGIVLADQGSEWYLTGCPDERWNNEQLRWLDENLQGSAFEAVDTSSLMIHEDSAACRQ